VKPDKDLLLASNWLDDQLPAMKRTVVRWCNQNSWSNHHAGLLAMADLLDQDFQEAAIRFERIDRGPWESISDDGVAVQHPTGPALIWHHRPDARRRLLLLIHYDTVYPPQTMPDSVVEADEGRLVGPGVADAKGGIAVIRYAVDAVLRFGLAERLGLTILLNPDEEIGSPSSTDLFQQMAPQFEFALVFEPTLPDGAMVANRKGTANYTAVVQGRSAHAGRNLGEGRNAVVQAARLATEVDSWNHLHPDISINVGRIAGGGPSNQVPRIATVFINARAVTPYAANEIAAKMKTLESRYSTTDGYVCQIHGRFHSPPKCVNADARFEELKGRVTRAAAQHHRLLQWRDTGGACDGSKLAAMGLPNVDTMGVCGGNLHSPDEYCESGSLVTAAKTLVHLIAEVNNES
jgi:glutamate carboxypeptidase